VYWLEDAVPDVDPDHRSVADRPEPVADLVQRNAKRSGSRSADRPPVGHRENALPAMGFGDLT
jgi:hypothetical protein